MTSPMQAIAGLNYRTSAVVHARGTTSNRAVHVSANARQANILVTASKNLRLASKTGGPSSHCLHLSAARSPAAARRSRSSHQPVYSAYDREFALNGADEYSTAEQVASDLGPNLVGKRVLITGANSGVGKETARVLGAVSGATVYLACRTAESARATAEELTALLPGDGEGSYVALEYAFDLGNLKEVQGACRATLFDHFTFGDPVTFTGLPPPIDVLICNAGLQMTGRETSTDGHEIHMAVNHLGHWAVVDQLMPAIERSPQPRVLVVSSETHRNSSLDLSGEALAQMEDSPMLGFVAYGNSKLANLVFAKGLADRRPNVRVHSLCPGLIDTGLSRHSREAMPEQVKKMYEGAASSGLLKTVEEGAATSVYLAATPAGDLEASGSYYTNCRPLAPSEKASCSVQGDELWEWSENIVKG